MKRYLSFLFTLLSLFCYSAIECSIQRDEMGEIYIRCFEDGQDDPNGGSPVLDKEKCEEIQQSVLDAVDSAQGLAEEIRRKLHDDFYQYLQNINNSNHVLYNEVSTLPPENPPYTTMMPEIHNIDSNLTLLFQWRLSALDSFDLVIDGLSQQRSKVNSYRCSDATCSGSGDMSCPCTEEFNTAIAAINHCNDIATSISESVASNALAVADMSLKIGAIADSFASITNRLNSPDDRMWSELNDLYVSLGSRLTNVVYSTVDLTNLFYTIKKMVRGQDDDNPVLQISTEGVIGLYQSVFEMVNTLQNNYSARQFDSAVVYFSNTVSRLFNDYNYITRSSLLVAPASSKYTQIYRVFTNNVYDARTRYLNLAGPLQSAVTNWFQRMELYQQAALGWFDNFTTGAYSEEQERTTESGLEHSFYETTNDLNTITAASSNLVASVDNTVMGVINELKTVQISASLPTTITLFPEIEIDDIGKFGPIDLDTTEFSDVCELARKVTSLVWRVSFWLVYVVLAVGVARVVFVLVLFVINLSKSL